MELTEPDEPHQVLININELYDTCFDDMAYLRRRLEERKLVYKFEYLDDLQGNRYK